MDPEARPIAEDSLSPPLVAQPPGGPAPGIAVRCRRRHRHVSGFDSFAVVPPDSGEEVWLSTTLQEAAPAGDVSPAAPRHPEWRIAGADDVRHGEAVSFQVAPWRAGPMRWLGHVVPRAYRISLASPDGSAHTVEVRAYPSDRLSATFNASEFGQLRQAFDAVTYAFGYWIDGFQCRTLEGVCKLEAGWEEGEEHEAHYRWELEVGFDPLVGVSGRYALGPLAAVPAVIRQHVLDAGVFIEVEGKVVLGGSIGRFGPRELVGAGGRLRAEGSVTFGIGVSAHVMRRVATVEVTGKTTLRAESDVVDDGSGRPALGVRVTWGGLQGEVKLQLVGGLQFSTQVTLVAPGVLCNQTFALPLPGFDAPVSDAPRYPALEPAAPEALG